LQWGVSLWGIHPIRILGTKKSLGGGRVRHGLGVSEKIASVRWPSWPGVGSLDAALIQHSLNLALRNQHPIPEADMAESPVMKPEVHPRPRNPEDLRQLGRRIMLFNHLDTLQVSPAKKSAGLIAQAKSQA
jgi:hypothetical protein